MGMYLVYPKTNTVIAHPSSFFAFLVFWHYTFGSMDSYGGK